MTSELDDIPVTRLLTADRTRCGADWGPPARVFKDPFARLYWITTGDGVVRQADSRRSWWVAPGRLVVIPARAPTCYHSRETMDLYWCHFTATVYGHWDWLAVTGCLLEREVAVAERPRIQFSWERLVAAWKAGTPAGRLEADGVLRQLLAGMLAATPPCRPPAGAREMARLQPVLEHIQNHLDRPLTLAGLAGLLHLQPTYFSNLFSRCLGEGPMAYAVRRRIERAQGLLRTTGAPLKAIAEQSGFRDVYYFSRMFRRVTGVPPAAFRRQAERVMP